MLASNSKEIMKALPDEMEAKDLKSPHLNLEVLGHKYPKRYTGPSNRTTSLSK